MMRNSSYNKGIVLVIIVLFLSVAVTHSIGISNNDDTTPPVTTHTLDPLDPDGLNDYYVSNVSVILEATDDISGVKEIKYQINDGPVETIPGNHGTFLITEDSNLHTVLYWAIDNVGNTETQKCFQLKMDQTPPEIDFEMEVKYYWFWYDIYLFNISAEDTCSCIGGGEIRINGRLMVDIPWPGPIHGWGFRFYRGIKVKIEIIFYNFAGLQGIVVINSEDINFHSRIYCNPQCLSLLFIRLFERFPFFERLQNIFGWDIV